MNNETISAGEKDLLKQRLFIDINSQLSEFNVPSDITIKNISELNSFKKLIQENSIPWVSVELMEFIDEVTDNFNNETNNTGFVDTTGFDYLNNNYDLEYEKTKFLLDFGSKLKTLGVPQDLFVNNISEFNSFNTLVKNFRVNPLDPLSFTSWLNNPDLKTFVNTKETEFQDLADPTKNNILGIQTSISSNLGLFKELLNIDIVPTLDQLTNILKLPEDFDISKLTNLLKIPNLSLESLPQLATLLNLPQIDLNSFGSDLEIPNIPSIPKLKIPKISGPMTGLNFNRMLNTVVEAQMKDFPEDTPWDGVAKFQAAQITKAVFEELSKMTFYIEPGEIKVLTNGSPSTHQGQNINRIKIKLK